MSHTAWEYRLAYPHTTTDLGAYFQQLGSDGWEYCGQAGAAFVFKRPLHTARQDRVDPQYIAPMPPVTVTFEDATQPGVSWTVGSGIAGGTRLGHQGVYQHPSPATPDSMVLPVGSLGADSIGKVVAVTPTDTHGSQT